MSEGARLAQAAKNFVGVRFRLHGRNPQIGMDCIGLLDASLRAIGLTATLPSGYRLRNHNIERWLPLAEQSGFYSIPAASRAGDVKLIRPAPGQHHILILTSAAIAVHAHASLGRIVCQRMDDRMAAVGAWRLAEQSEGQL